MFPLDHRAWPAALAVLSIGLAGCADTHGLIPRAVQRDPNQFAAAVLKDAAVPVRPEAWPAERWWSEFGDPQLDQLILEGLAGSPTLHLAAARVRLAEAQAQEAGARQSPHLNADTEAVRGRFSDHGFLPPPLAGNYDTVFQLEATLSWSIDFWGKDRAAYEQTLGLKRAAELDAAEARLSLAVNIAQLYVQLQQDYLALDVAQETLRQREQIFQLTRDRNAAGIDSRLELKQAEAAVPAAREHIEQLQEAAAHSRNALAALIGAGPDRALAITRPAARPLTEPALPSVLPAELLGRRPDVLAQLERIEAARQGVKAARADFYPNVNLLAFAGAMDIGPAGLFSWGNRQYGIAPAVTLPLFDAGRRRASLAAQDAQTDAEVEHYNQTLADALRDVADQLTALRSLREQRGEQRTALAAAQEAYELAVLRYREGIGNYLQVLSTETQLLAQRDLDAELSARGLTLSINLIRALGGGFTPAARPPATGD
jgi:NodT family efflux transporter outer membrane factor (OMF) lipoprotein